MASVSWQRKHEIVLFWFRSLGLSTLFYNWKQSKCVIPIKTSDELQIGKRNIPRVPHFKWKLQWIGWIPGPTSIASVDQLLNTKHYVLEKKTNHSVKQNRDNIKSKRTENVNWTQTMGSGWISQAMRKTDCVYVRSCCRTYGRSDENRHVHGSSYQKHLSIWILLSVFHNPDFSYYLVLGRILEPCPVKGILQLDIHSPMTENRKI